ncbi:MAG: N-acetylmuramic acid 6-phosphate etherase, partial [Erysipelotrichaceae bacterium]|nr:N-acetylmuramic acid 6-phosphate etherase [Erysipelotrichaceae bacterium]
KDFVIGIAASGRTPYVIGGLDYARSIGCKTGCVCCNFNTEIGKHCDYPIELSAGPEILTGSTRLKSGTCQKIVLNMISTVTMVKSNKVFGNLMVDVRATNEKLVERCHRIVMEATGCDHDTAHRALSETNNSCKDAIVMVLLNVSAEEARAKLEKAEENVRNALK